MMSEQPKVTLQWGTESGDGKRAYIYAKENDGWKDLRLELDTDDCDGEHARAMMQVVIDRCNAPTTAPTPPESAPQSAPAQGEPTETVMRNALCRVYEIINGSDDFDADEVNAIIKAATGNFPISREWSMGAAYKEEIVTLRQQLAQMEEERDQARQDLEERCAENDRERAAHLQAYQAVTRERDEARGEALGRKTQLTYAQGLLTAAESELAELRLDRERIEWLDKNVTVAAKYRCQRPCSDHDGPTYWSFNWSQWHNNEENSLTIRAAIDAARQSSSTHQHSANQTKHE